MNSYILMSGYDDVDKAYECDGLLYCPIFNEGQSANVTVHQLRPTGSFVQLGTIYGDAIRILSRYSYNKNVVNYIQIYLNLNMYKSIDFGEYLDQYGNV